MNAKELRIGNLIYVPEFEMELTVQSITEDLINYAYELERLEPIHLTEEGLIKFGFVNDSEDACNIIFSDCAILSIELSDLSWGVYSHKNDFNKGAGYCHWEPINYVHELQNLYFALTSKELKTK